ncbi:competence protein ComK [Ornithinibacillus scapharcae]|uniref:competence protein ComK n=1 Tax=Ornithinibacillus scapharcae TaxID=1147159 RepID=UPI000225BDCB|nr:competence protein ComK [Ornithinibacillus scapharcae]
MISVHPHYEITEQTVALIPSKHIDYQTIVIEVDKELYIKKTPFEIIEKGCLDNFSTFEGRRKAVMHLTGFRRKVPIPISVYRGIFVFPTQAFRDWDCCWVFYGHVEGVVEIGEEQSLVLFKGGRQVRVDVSKVSLLKQLERARFVISLIRRQILS